MINFKVIAGPFTTEIGITREPEVIEEAEVIEEPEEEISEVFATPSAKPELSKLNDKLLTNLEYDEKKEESKEKEK